MLESIVETWRTTSLHFFVFLRHHCNNMRKRLWLIWSLFFAVILAQAQNDTVLFSAQGGFYDNVFALRLSNTNPQYHIRYTTNGNNPTAQSPRYEGAMTLNASMFSKSNIYTINNTIPSQFYLPNDVKRGIVIRAAVFDENDSCVSWVVSNSYFIRSLGCDLHGLPVLSIMADSLSLFDYETGNFVPGINYDPADSTHTGNYKMRGDEWERQINMEFYEPDNTGINQLCGMRTHGNASRWFQQKGMKLFAREEYGKKHFLFRFFKDSPIVKYKNFCLHPYRCSNWLQMGGTDYLSQKVAGKLNIDALSVRQIVLFINGEYWGIYTMEESADEHYLKEHYNADLDSIAIVKYWGLPNYGDINEWRSFYSFMSHADLTQPEDSAYAYDHMDVPSFIDYILLETFTANLDWVNNNVKIGQLAPGKPFRMMFYDGDGCFSRVDYQALDHALQQEGNSMVMNRFLENKGFRFQFCKRYNELSQTSFGYDFMKSVLDEYRQLVEGEVEDQYNRFHFPWSMNRWFTDMEKADEFMRQRHEYFREEIKDYLAVWESTSVAVSCYPNPFTDEIRLRYQSNNYKGEEVAIYDVMGRKVFSGTCSGNDNGNEIIFKPHLPAGVYVLKVGSYAQRIVRY